MLSLSFYNVWTMMIIVNGTNQSNGSINDDINFYLLYIWTHIQFQTRWWRSESHSSFNFHAFFKHIDWSISWLIDIDIFAPIFFSLLILHIHIQINKSNTNKQNRLCVICVSNLVMMYKKKYQSIGFFVFHWWW